MGQPLRLVGNPIGEVFLEYLCELGVQLMSFALEQPVVGNVLHQGVLESVGGMGGDAAAVHESRFGQLPQGLLELLRAQRRDPGEQRVRELPANAGTDLDDVLYW